MSAGRKKPRNTKKNAQEKDTIELVGNDEEFESTGTVQHELIEEEAEDNGAGVKDTIHLQEVRGAAEKFQLQTELHTARAAEPPSYRPKEDTDRKEENVWERRFKLLVETIERQEERQEQRFRRLEAAVERRSEKSSREAEEESSDGSESSERSQDTVTLDGLLRRERQTDSSSIRRRLRVTKEEEKEIAKESNLPEEINLDEDPTEIALGGITDTLALVIEKRRLAFTYSWPKAWIRIRAVANKPALPEKVWKKLAYGEYTDLSDFNDYHSNQTSSDIDTPFKVADGGQVYFRKERKRTIFNLSHWLEAWSRFTTVTLIICKERKYELSVHQSRVTQFSAVYAFNNVYEWDIARRKYITEHRERTLLCVEHDIDARFLRLGNHSTRYVEYPDKARYGQSNNRKVCRRYNWSNRCNFGNICLFQHECQFCGGQHPARSCETSGSGAGNKRRNTDYRPGNEKKNRNESTGGGQAPRTAL